MTQNEHYECAIEEINNDIRDLDIASEALTNDIQLKQIELSALQKKREVAVKL